MSYRGRFTEAEILEICETLVARGQVMAQGVEALRLLRRAIERIFEQAGLVPEWDPGSPVDLSEWFDVTALTAVRWAIAGGAAGLILCGLSRQPGLGTAIGAGVGAAIGAIQGHEAVRSGWRLRSYRNAQGKVCIELQAPARPGP